MIALRDTSNHCLVKDELRNIDTASSNRKVKICLVFLASFPILAVSLLLFDFVSKITERHDLIISQQSQNISLQNQNEANTLSFHKEKFIFVRSFIEAKNYRLDDILLQSNEKDRFTINSYLNKTTKAVLPTNNENKKETIPSKKLALPHVEIDNLTSTPSTSKAEISIRPSDRVSSKPIKIPVPPPPKTLNETNITIATSPSKKKEFQKVTLVEKVISETEIAARSSNKPPLKKEIAVESLTIPVSPSNTADRTNTEIFDSRVNEKELNKEITVSQALEAHGKTETIELNSGFGVNINFTNTNIFVKKAWLDDPSQIALTVDGSLCNSNDDCEGTQIIHLKRTSTRNTSIAQNKDDSTLLTLVAETSSGIEVLTFIIALKDNVPSFSTVNIVREESKNICASTCKNTLLDAVTARSMLKTEELDDSYNIIEFYEDKKDRYERGNYLRIGLSRARTSGLIEYNSPLRQKLERGIDLLREGHSLSEVSERIQVEIAQIEQVIKIGSV